jgi:hypothetical protein
MVFVYLDEERTELRVSVVAPTTARDKVRSGFAGAWRTLGLGAERLAMAWP